ncbi:MAG TPA: hypothetical protein VFC00_09710 [Micromonosporaceae bacterium]|nr:hypothetical protein [Micromonosporaceae bacterium]
MKARDSDREIAKRLRTLSGWGAAILFVASIVAVFLGEWMWAIGCLGAAFAVSFFGVSTRMGTDKTRGTRNQFPLDRL